jgi:hypothetical protein
MTRMDADIPESKSWMRKPASLTHRIVWLRMIEFLSSIPYPRSSVQSAEKSD